MRFITYLCIFLFLISTATAASIMPVKCTDGTIVMTDNFSAGDDICLYGTGFTPGETVDLYVVDNQSYAPGQAYVDVSGAVEQATTDARGILKLQKIWSDIKQGLYDFIADRNRDHAYDTGDVVNAATYHPATNETEQPPAEEVPEFGTLAALFLLIGIGIIIHRRRRL